MIKHFWKSQEGAAAVIVALILTVLLGFVGLAIDIGNLYAIRTQMQNAVDAAVCAGGLQLKHNPPTQAEKDNAITVANNFIKSNNFNSAEATIDFIQDPIKNPNPPYAEINCSMTHSVATYFMGLFGYKTVPITVSAKAIIQQTGSAGPDSSSGPFKYALFSKDDLTLSGNKTIKGSVHTDSNLSWSGNKTITQNVEGKTVSISGNTTVANNGTPGSIIADTPNDISYIW